MIKLHNSLGKQVQEFSPIVPGQASVYSCGPTVYHFVHLGNLRTYIFTDTLKRVLRHNGLQVNHAMNITDVGHLTSDEDAGDDKLEKGAAREGKSVWDIAKFYTDAFLADMDKLNIIRPDTLCPATDHIPEQIALIQELEQKGFTYDTPEAVYFEVSKFPEYGRLSGQKLEDKQTAAREGVVTDSAKRHPADFALWFKRTGKFANHIMHWDSPWGDGFPGWHIECSAMSAKYLGQPFDIHTGGIDLLPVHHTNEIAQSQAAKGRPLANYWLHGEHLLVNEGRMGKSEGNAFTLAELEAKGYSPLAYRYLTLTAHYRSKLNFTWESLDSARNALNNLYEAVSSFDAPGQVLAEYGERFREAVNDDLDTPKALAVTWELIRSDAASGDKLGTLLEFDQVLGLRIREAWEEARTVPPAVQEMISRREEARQSKDYARSDELRREIEAAGYALEDKPDGVVVKKKF